VIEERESVPQRESPHERQPSYTLTPEGILVVTIHNYEDLTDVFAAVQKMTAIKAEIPQARGVLFDLRAVAPPWWEMVNNLSLVFRWSEIASALSSTPLVTAGERSRMHIGFATHGAASDYTSAFRVVDGRRISPAPEARDIPVVFLLNGWSGLPPEALALQVAGKAAIVVEGNPSDVSLGVKTHPIQLSDGVVAEIRLSEIVCQDGSGGLYPDVIIEPSHPLGEKDEALATALGLLKNFKLSRTERAPLPAYAAPPAENAYPEMTLPPLEYRLLAAFRIWTAINYFFPYKDLMEEDWDGVLEEFIPRIEQADSALSYHLAVAEMITHIHDLHGEVYSPVLEQYFGSAFPPIGLQIVENVPVVTIILDQEIAKAAGVSIGDVVLEIDGENMLDRMAERAKYIAASTPQIWMHVAVWDSLSGPEGSQIVLTVRDRENRVKQVKLPRRAEHVAPNVGGRSGEVIRLLTEEIGYADLDRLQVSEVDEMFETLKHTKAIVFDMRGFPQATAWSIAPRLTEENGVKAALFQRPFVMTPDGPNGAIASRSINYTFVQALLPTEKWRYRGKTVMLIDERTLSQAEHTGLFFEAANGTVFVGSHTGGVNGDITSFCVPGGIFIMFTGQAVRHADGRQLQRIGLVPDIEVRPTIEGIRNGRDEVLEGAIQYLEREIEKARQKR
jgi:C-terminal processing protease CtpA/Prc